jgi:hypothetical protein
MKTYLRRLESAGFAVKGDTVALYHPYTYEVEDYGIVIHVLRSGMGDEYTIRTRNGEEIQTNCFRRLD